MYINSKKKYGGLKYIFDPGFLYFPLSFPFFVSKLTLIKMANEFKVLVYMTTIIGTGVALMKYTVPNEDEIVKVP